MTDGTLAGITNPQDSKTSNLVPRAANAQDPGGTFATPIDATQYFDAQETVSENTDAGTASLAQALQPQTAYTEGLDPATAALIEQLLLEDKLAQEAEDARLARRQSESWRQGREHATPGRFGQGQIRIPVEYVDSQLQTAGFGRQNDYTILTRPRPATPTGKGKEVEPIIAEPASNDAATATGNQAESSASGAQSTSSYGTATGDGQGTCLTCTDQFPLSDLIQAPCNHYYCRDCILEFFTFALQDISFFPPKCCGRPIALDSVRSLLTPEMITSFTTRKTELETPNGTYCSNKSCSAFITPLDTKDIGKICHRCGTGLDIMCPTRWCENHYGKLIQRINQGMPERCSVCRRPFFYFCPNRACVAHGQKSDSGTRKDDQVTCVKCGTVTCTICKGEGHRGDCPEDKDLQKLLETAQQKNWSRCMACGRVLERIDGCNEVLCLCGVRSCYACGARWKTCNCPKWPDPDRREGNVRGAVGPHFGDVDRADFNDGVGGGFNRVFAPIEPPRGIEHIRRETLGGMLARRAEERLIRRRTGLNVEPLNLGEFGTRNPRINLDMTLYQVRPDGRGTGWEELEARRLDLLEEEARTGAPVTDILHRMFVQLPRQYDHEDFLAFIQIADQGLTAWLHAPVAENRERRDEDRLLLENFFYLWVQTTNADGTFRLLDQQMRENRRHLFFLAGLGNTLGRHLVPELRFR